MAQRLDYTTASPAAFKAMLQLEAQLHGCGLEESLLEEPEVVHLGLAPKARPQQKEKKRKQ